MSDSQQQDDSSKDMSEDDTNDKTYLKFEDNKLEVARSAEHP